MPRNGSGQYNPLTNTWNPPVTGVLATGADFQAQLNDISAAITQSVSKDGQTPMTANLPMGNNSIVGIASGTETSPSISANGDTNTGLYFPAADTVAIATGGVKRVEVDANGNVGVGITPSAWVVAWRGIDVGSYSAIANASGNTRIYHNAYTGSLDTYKNTGAAAFYGMSGGVHSWYTAPSGTAGNPITFTQAMTLTSDGNLLVGCTSVPSNSNRIDGIAVRAEYNGDTTMICSHAGTGSNYEIVFQNGNGIAGSITTAGSATAYNQTSDYRLKENIQPMTGALANIAKLKPCTYNWKVDGSDGQGFIAHELQAVFPDAVTGEKDAVDAEGNPKYQGIDTSFLVATLTAAIKEQQALIEAQKTAIESLTARITALEAK